MKHNRFKGTKIFAFALFIVVSIFSLNSLAATLHGTKFQDKDVSGAFNAGDAPYVGHQIMIRNNLTGEVFRTETDNNGYYEFTDIPANSDDLFYIYESNLVDLPQITQITPFFGAQGETLTLSLTTANTQLVDGKTTLEIAGANVLNITVIDATTAQASISIPTNASFGLRNVYLKTEGQNAVKLDGFIVYSPALASSIESLLGPIIIEQGESKKLAVIGVDTHFNQADTKIYFHQQGITASAVNVISTLALETTLQVASNADTTAPYYFAIVTNHEFAPFIGELEIQPKQIQLVDFGVNIDGDGSVNIQPQDIDCQTSCAIKQVQNDIVTLQAQPANRFIGWEDDCVGTDETITLTLDSHKQCTAVFAPPEFTLSLQLDGSGHVTSSPAGINCSQNPCEAHFASDTPITLQSTDKDINVTGDADCGINITLTQDTTCTVTLTDKPKIDTPTPEFTLSLQLDGSGHVTSSPVGIDCSQNPCEAHFASDTSIILQSTDKDISVTGDSDCATNMTLTQDTTCTVTLTDKPQIDTPVSEVTLNLKINGSGQVTSSPAGIDCSQNPCQASFTPNTSIILQSAGKNISVTGDSDCGINMTLTQDTTCTVTLVNKPTPRPKVALNLQIDGTGQVTSSPAGINCSQNPCRTYFTINTYITLESVGNEISVTGDTDCGVEMILKRSMTCSVTLTSTKVDTSILDQVKNCNSKTDSIQKALCLAALALDTSDTTPPLINPTPPTSNSTPSSTPATPTDTVSTVSTSTTTSKDTVATSATTPPVDPVTSTVPTASSTTSAPAVTTNPTISPATSSSTPTDSAPTESDSSTTLTAPTPTSATDEDLTGTASSCPNQKEINWVCDADWTGLDKLERIGPHGNISNVKLSGYVENQGRIGNFILDAGATLENTATSSISGYITNGGTIKNCNFKGGELTGGVVGGIITGKATTTNIIKNVEFLPDTQLSGVILEGNISGDIDSPAFIDDSRIYGHTQLHNITFGNNVILSPEVVLIENVKVSNATQLPNDFMHLMPTLKPSVSCADAETLYYPELLDVNQHVLTQLSLLDDINQIPELQDNNQLLQWQDTYNYLYWTVGDKRYAVIPVWAQKTLVSTRRKVMDDGISISFITPNQFQIMTYPALQAPCELQQALKKQGWQLSIENNGYLRIFNDEEAAWLSVQPSLASYPIESTQQVECLLSENMPYMADSKTNCFMFERNGQRYKQYLFPAPAFPTELEKHVKNLIFAEEMVCFKYWGQPFCGVLNDVVTPAKENNSTRFSVQTVPDANNDGLEDFVIHYQNGDEQIGFALDK